MTGPCSKCGAPGVLQNAPGAPYSDIFCDACWRKEARWQLYRPYGCILFLAAVVAGVLYLIRHC